MPSDDDVPQDVDHTPPVAADEAMEATDEAASTSRAPSESPEVVGPEEMEDMRSRALAIKATTTAGDVEKELVDMILRLTSAGIPLKSQLMEQADTIANLSSQREFILQRTEEERGRWNAERESWSRVADAVFTQANKPTPTIYKDPTKPPLFLESDNAVLRMKLSDAQQRLSALEGELAHLKPVLLMKPFTLAHSLSGVKRGNKKKQKDDVPVAGPSSSTEETTPKADTSQRPYYRPAQPPITFLPPIVHKPKGTSVGKKGPIHADARSEHLLLAARRIGRERATMLSSAAFKSEELDPPAFITSPPAKGKGKVVEHHIHPMPGNPYTLHYPTTPKTPQKASPMGVPPFASPGAVLPYPPRAQHIVLHSPQVPRMPGASHPTSYAFVPGPIPGPAYALYTPGYGYGPMPPPAMSPTRPSPGKGPPTLHIASPQNAPSAQRASPSKNPTEASLPRTKRPPGKRKTRVQPSDPPVPSSSKSITTSNSGPKSATSASPLSAFDLLHSAAQSVLSPAADMDSNARMQATGKRLRQAAVEGDGDVETSPTPSKKRARIVAEPPDHGSRGARGIGRASSALDVLADQAMFFGSQSTRSKAGSNVSHSRSGSEVSVGDVGPMSAISPVSAMDSPTLQPARWDSPAYASSSKSMGPPRATDRRFDAIAPKSKPPAHRTTTNGQSSRRSTSRITAQNHDRADHATGDGTSASEDNIDESYERGASVDEGPATSTSALPTQRGAQSSSNQQQHEQLRKEWLKKLGMFKQNHKQ